MRFKIKSTTRSRNPNTVWLISRFVRQTGQREEEPGSCVRSKACRERGTNNENISLWTNAPQFFWANPCFKKVVVMQCLVQTVLTLALRLGYKT